MIDGVQGMPFGQADLTTCDREIIHLPGCVQSHGLLLVLSPDLLIEQVGGDTEALLGAEPASLLGLSLADLVDADRLPSLAAALGRSTLDENPLYLDTLPVGSARRSFHLSGHRVDEYVVVELEPEAESTLSHSQDAAAVVKNLLDEICKAPNLEALAGVVARRVRELTGFDRVWVYRFHPDDHGEVIAEDRPESLPPYLGLHYPATDIPLPARQLFLKNWLRLIHDADAAPSDLLPAENPRTGRRLDMTYCTLRAVSPIHIEYLHNMGIRSTMSLSLIDNGRLLGLVSCNARVPQSVPLGVRASCELLARTTSLLLGSVQSKADGDYKLQLQATLTALVESLSSADDFNGALLARRDRLARFIRSGSFALLAGATFQSIGATPSEAAVRQLVDWLGARADGPIWATDSLADEYPPAAGFAEVGAGMLAVQISPLGKTYLLWFRPSQARTVTWAGDPAKEEQITPEGARIHPRKSFELWQETVEGRSVSWQHFEIQAARDLRNALLNVVLRQAEAVELLNRELQRSNVELDAFAYVASHDLKEPLRGIHNYAAMLLEDSGDRLDAESRGRLEAMGRLTQRMEDLLDALLRYSRLGRHELAHLDVPLGSLLHEVVDTLRTRLDETATTIRIGNPLPVVVGDRALLRELFTNMVSNAIKYNDKSERWIEIGTAGPGHGDNEAIIFVRDNGIGIPEQHHGSIFRIFRRLHPRAAYGGGAGAGLTIVQKIVERHGGRIWLESSPGVGSTFYVALPME